MTTLAQEHEPLGMPRSVLRHRPIHPDVQEWVMLGVPRTHRSKAHPEPHTSGGLLSLTPARSPWMHTHAFVLIGMSMLVTLALLWALQGLWLWSSVQLDTLRYGYPRTTQIARDVGHGGVSLFIATNQGGQVYIVEIPAESPARAHLLIGPHLLGPGTDLLPVHLTLVGNVQHLDLLIEVGGTAMRFTNTGKSYIPTTTP